MGHQGDTRCVKEIGAAMEIRCCHPLFGMEGSEMGLEAGKLFGGNIPLPDQVATEEQTEDEDEDGCAENHDVYVERKVLESNVRHPETVMLEV